MTTLLSNQIFPRNTYMRYNQIQTTCFDAKGRDSIPNTPADFSVSGESLHCWAIFNGALVRAR